MDIDPVAAGSLSFMGLAGINRTSRDGVRHSGSTRNGWLIRVGGRGGYCSTSEPLRDRNTLGGSGGADGFVLILRQPERARDSQRSISTHPAAGSWVVR